MKLPDQLQFNFQLLRRHRLRTALLLLSITIGVASVIMLTSLGEGARRYVEREFTALGNQMLIVLPGRVETTGGAPPVYGTSPRDLTFEDAQAFRQINGISRIAPVIAGTGRISYRSVARDVITIGTTADFFAVRNLNLALGSGLPDARAGQVAPVCILGAKLRERLFGHANPINQWLRIGDYRFRVVGVLAERGESLGLDMREMVIIPLLSAQALFNSPGLFRVILEFEHPEALEHIKTRIREVIRQRHEGEDDVTLISQDSILSSFNQILTTLTLTVAGIAAISLVVAGVLIMNISLISVSQRRREIGLLKALGASASSVRKLFLGEALLLTFFGSLLGIALGELVIALALRLYPAFPLAAPWWAALSATIIAVVCGAVFAWYPARRAARLDPVQALRGGQP